MSLSHFLRLIDQKVIANDSYTEYRFIGNKCDVSIWYDLCGLHHVLANESGDKTSMYDIPLGIYIVEKNGKNTDFNIVVTEEMTEIKKPGHDPSSFMKAFKYVTIEKLS